MDHAAAPDRRHSLWRGAARLWRRARTGRAARLWQALAYAAGWLALGAALVSPLHAIGEECLTAHMVEHEIVMSVAAPLLVLARPGGVLLWAFPTRLRQGIGVLVRQGVIRHGWAVLTLPAAATVLHAVAIWVWHIPPFFDAALGDLALHRLQHLCFFVTAILFWWSMLWRSDPAVAAGDLFITMIHTGILGALMTFSPRVYYAAQTVQSEAWGLLSARGPATGRAGHVGAGRNRVRGRGDRLPGELDPPLGEGLEDRRCAGAVRSRSGSPHCSASSPALRAARGRRSRHRRAHPPAGGGASVRWLPSCCSPAVALPRAR